MTGPGGYSLLLLLQSLAWRLHRLQLLASVILNPGLHDAWVQHPHVRFHVWFNALPSVRLEDNALWCGWCAALHSGLPVVAIGMMLLDRRAHRFR
jgi:3',5'-cyclic AMP phosphodiesterase CpdA